MLTLAAIPLTCWLCALIALPRKPLPDNEVQELVYARLLGRQRTLMLFALLVTLGGLLVLLATVRPSHVDADLDTVRRANVACIQVAYNLAPCGTPQPNVLLIREIQDDGRPAVVTTVVVPTK